MPRRSKEQSRREHLWRDLWEQPAYLRLHERKDRLLKAWNHADAYGEREKAAHLAELSKRAVRRIQKYEDALFARHGTSAAGRDVEGVGHHGYAPPRHETPAERARRLAERRRRYRRLSQSPGEQGPGYDVRRRRRARRRVGASARQRKRGRR